VDVDVEIVRTIVALAWNLGMDVVAEGGNKQQINQIQMLILLRFISKPLDSKTAESLVQRLCLAMNVG